MQDMNDAYSSVLGFNYLIGNFDKLEAENNKEFNFQVFKDQALRVVEEAGEMLKSSSDEDIVGCVDGAWDAIITAFGALAQLTKYADVCLAGNLILENNMKKMTTNEAEAVEWAAWHSEQGTQCYVYRKEDNEGQSWYCVKNRSQNKVLKPKDFVGVDLSGCIFDTDVSTEETVEEVTNESSL